MGGNDLDLFVTINGTRIVPVLQDIQAARHYALAQYEALKVAADETGHPFVLGIEWNDGAKLSWELTVRPERN